jgi:hypothetical protein
MNQIPQHFDESDRGRVTILTGFSTGQVNPYFKNQGVGVYATKLNGEVKRFFSLSGVYFLPNEPVVDPVHSERAAVLIRLKTKRVLVLERGIS